jgi:cytochrome b subunit of formate dehydrogenase
MSFQYWSKTLAGAGAAILCYGLLLAGDYVSMDSGVSSRYLWTVVASGFVVALTGMVMWCRNSSRNEHRTVSKILLGLGGLAFLLAMLGHIFLTLVVIAVPLLLIGVVIRFVPSAEPHV